MSSARQTIGTRQRRAPLARRPQNTHHSFSTASCLKGRAPAGARRGRPPSWPKLLYVRVNPQHWVLVAGDAMVQSYEPEKMWRPVRGALLSSCLAKQRCLDMKPGCHISVRHLGEKRDWSQAALPTNEAQTTVPCDPPQLATGTYRPLPPDNRVRKPQGPSA